MMSGATCKHHCRNKPLFVWVISILQVTGFYIEFDEDTQNTYSGKCLTILSKIYCVAGKIILWINVFRYLTIFVGDNRLSGSLMSSLSFLFFWVLCAYVSTTLSLSLPVNLRRCLERIEAHRDKITNREDYFRHLKTVAVIIGILVVCGFASSSFTLSGTSEDILPSLRRHITPVNYLEGTAYTVGISFYYVMQSFLGIQACGAVVFFTVMAVCLHREFSYLSKQFETFITFPNILSKQIMKNMDAVEFGYETKYVAALKSTELRDISVSETVDEKFQRLVEGHQRMREIMDISNKYLSHIVAAAYLFVMPIICFLLFSTIKGGLSLDEWIFSSINCVFNTGILVIVTATGIMINDKAHNPLRHIFASNWIMLSGNQLEKLSLFVTSLTAEQTGLSVYGLFVVDRSTTLMVCGTILTYAIVVLQLNPSSEANCLDVIRRLNTSKPS